MKKSKTAPNADFKEARTTELNGLIANGTFIQTRLADLPPNTRIFGSRFVDELKRAGENIRHKSRLIAQKYQGNDSTTIAKKGPTVDRASQRLLLSLAASLPNMRVLTRDITQAYIQSHTPLERAVYIEAPEELGLPPGTVLHVVKPLYGIPESGLHWYLTYLEHHVERLGMQRAITDPCVLMRRNANGHPDGLIILQVDDSLAYGSPTFMNDEQKAATDFNSKPRDELPNAQLSLNGTDIRQQAETKKHNNQSDKED